MTYRILNTEFEPSAERINYAIIAKKHREIAFPLAQTFIQEFETEFHNADEAVEKMEDMSVKYFVKAIDSIISYLCQFDVFVVDQEAFLSRLQNTSIMQRWTEEYQDILNRYGEIVFDAEAEKAYREERKDSRGRIVGGGFGVEGAIKGMATAGAINMATGMAHSIFNSFGNMVTNHYANKEKAKLFNTLSVRLGQALYDTICDFRFVTMDVLNEECGVVYDYPNCENIAKASSMLSNLQANRIPEEKIPSIVHQILLLNPFDIQIYEYLLSNGGDPECAIEQLGDKLGINIREIKIEHIEAALSAEISKIEKKHVDDLEKVTLEKDLLELQKKIPAIKDVMGFQGKIDSEERLSGRITELAKETRTVEHIIFNTAEEAASARADIALFEQFVKQNGIDNVNIKEQILKLPFQTKFVLHTLDERLKVLRAAADSTDLPDKIMDVFHDCCFYDASLSSYISKDALMKQLFIPGVSAEAEMLHREAEHYVPFGKEEVIAFILKGKHLLGSTNPWFIMGNVNLYLLEIKDGILQKKHVVPYLSVDKVKINKSSELTILCNDGSIYSLFMSLTGVDHTVDGGAEDLTAAFTRIMQLLLPITKGREPHLSVKEQVSEPANLDLSPWEEKFKSIRELCYDQEDFDKAVAFIGVSERYNKMLLEQRTFWQSEFKNETVYLMIHTYVRGSLYEGMLLTNRAFYYLKAGQSSKSSRIKIGDVTKVCIKGFWEAFTVETADVSYSVTTYNVPDKCVVPLASFTNELIHALTPETSSATPTEAKPAAASVIRAVAPVTPVATKERSFDERIEELKKLYQGKNLNIALRDHCKYYKEKIDALSPSLLSYNEKKLRNQFDIPFEERIYIACDATVFGSCKEGFAITPLRLLCRSGGTLYSMRIKELRDYKSIRWESFKLYMRSRLLADVLWDSNSPKELLKALYEDIAMLVTEVFAEELSTQTPVLPIASAPSETSAPTNAVLAKAPSSDSPEKKEQIKALCMAFSQGRSIFNVSPKLIKGLGLASYSEVYFAYDATVFNSGKNGFAITDAGFVCRNMFEDRATLFPFEKIAKALKIEWSTTNKIELMADKLVFLYVSGMNDLFRDQLKELVEKIREIINS